MKSEYGYVSLITNMRYFPGILALQYSLMATGTRYPFQVIIPEDAEEEMLSSFEKYSIDYIKMPPLPQVMQIRKENKIAYWTETLFKLNLFRLTQYKKIIFLDADMIVMNSLDALFAKKHMSAVAAGEILHPNWKNGLNSGLMVIEPSQKDFEQMLLCVPDTIESCEARGRGFGDQDVINAYYADWKDTMELHLPEEYNAMYGFGRESYIKAIALQAHKPVEQLYVLHFIGVYKPWNYPFPKKCLYLTRLLVRRDWAEWKAWKIYRSILGAALHAPEHS